MIIANLATYPGRKISLQKTVDSILDQVDVLNVYLNEYDHIPECLKKSKIQCVLGKNALGDIRDNGKFYFLNKMQENAYYFTIDDDIIYPKDYVQILIEKLQRYDNQIIIGVHGMIFPQNFFDFVDTRTVFHFMNDLPVDVRVSALGTGTVVFHSSTLRNLKIDFFQDVGMADLWLAAYCRLNDISLICIAHKKEWLIEDQQETSLWQEFKDDHFKQNELVKKYKLWDISFGMLEYYRAVLETDLQKRTEELQEIKTSKSFRIGSLFFRSFGSFRKIVLFPINFFQIMLESKKR